MTAPYEYDFRIFQDGVMVARVIGRNIEQVRSEVRHYIRQYIQDRVDVWGDRIDDLDFTFADGDCVR
jgi:hypothetical protein